MGFNGKVWYKSERDWCGFCLRIIKKNGKVAVKKVGYKYLQIKMKLKSNKWLKYTRLYKIRVMLYLCHTFIDRHNVTLNEKIRIKLITVYLLNDTIRYNQVPSVAPFYFISFNVFSRLASDVQRASSRVLSF